MLHFLHFVHFFAIKSGKMLKKVNQVNEVNVLKRIFIYINHHSVILPFRFNFSVTKSFAKIPLDTG